MNREVKKKMKKAKVEWIEEQCRKTEMGMTSGKSKEAYNHPHCSHQDPNSYSNQQSAVIEDSSRNTLTEKRSCSKPVD